MTRTETSTSRLFFGLLLAALGVVLLLGNLGLLSVDFSRLWPLFPMSPGLVFLAIHFADRSSRTQWAVIPGTIIVYVSLVLFLIAFNLVDMSIFWPLFPLAVGLAFLTMYAFGVREDHWPLYPGTILTGIAVIFLMNTLIGWEWWPLLLVGAGVFVLLRR